MARRRRSQKQEEETLVDLVEARDSAQQFFEDNRNLIIGAVVGLVLLVGAYIAYNYAYKQPREITASEALYRAEAMFAQDSFAKALDNPGGGNLGFLDLIDEYGGTEAGNMAKYYAGISWLHLGKFDAAIDLLEDYDADGNLLPTLKLTTLGDAYAEKGDMDKAESFYKKAASATDNYMVTGYALKKLGMFYEYQNKPEQAKEVYSKLEKEYPNSPDGQDIEKYLMRVNQ